MEEIRELKEKISTMEFPHSNLGFLNPTPKFKFELPIKSQEELQIISSMLPEKEDDLVNKVLAYCFIIKLIISCFFS